MSDAVLTPAAPASSDVIGAMSDSDRHAWRMTGDIPKPDPAGTEPAHTSDVTQESSSAAPDAQAAEIAASQPPTSEAGTPKKHNAETRKAELNAEILALKAQRDALKSEVESSARRPTAPPDVKAESSPATQPVSLDSVIANPDVARPMLSEEAFYTQFPDASVGAYVRYAARYEHRLASFEQQQTQTLRSREAFYGETAAKVAAESPDIIAKLPPQLLGAKPVDLLEPGEAPGPWNIAVHEILSSPEAGRLLAHLADHPDVAQKIGASRTQQETIRIIAQIEARLASAPVSPAAPAAIPVSLAPPPPATLGKKPGQPADELADAVKTGDFARYRELQNNKDLKSA
jgi:hypothetical protein